MSAAERQARRRERDPEGVAAVRRAYLDRNRQLIRDVSRRRREAEPAKKRAMNAVSNAVRDGRLERGTCERLNDGDCLGRVEGHHDSYDRPLEVRWLCARHHKREHRATLAA